jgi:hypothetical protein
MFLRSNFEKKGAEMARGRREKPKLDGAKLPATVLGLSPDEQLAYEELRSDLNRHGWGQRADLQCVILGARRLAKVRKFAALVEGLPELLMDNGNGREIMHPYCKELRQSEADLADSLRVLLLSPGARKSVRTGGREMEQETESVNPKTAKLLKLMP